MKWKRHWGSWLEMKYCIINTQEYCFPFRSRHRRSRELHVHSGEVTGGTPSHPGQAHDPYGRPVQQSWWVTVGATGRREQHHINKRHACLAAQSCPTLCNSFACSPPASSVHGIFQARILQWVGIFLLDLQYYISFSLYINIIQLSLCIFSLSTIKIWLEFSLNFLDKWT